MIQKEKKKGFTLVELIIIMTILAILATISYIYFSSNLAKSRDSARMTDFETIESGINLFKVDRESYPTPDNGVNISYSGTLIWKQGTFGAGVAQKLKGFTRAVPVDPLYNNEYTYSVLSDNKSFQIGGILEDGESSSSTLSNIVIPKAIASSGEMAYVTGNYNGFITQAIKSGVYYFIATPSIITNDTSNTDIITILTNQKIVFNGFKNLPSSYSGKTDINGGFYFDSTQPIVFSGSLVNLYSYQTLLDIDKAIKNAYNGTPIQNNNRYAAYISGSGIGQLKSILSKYFKISWNQYLNCSDIREAGGGSKDGYYAIDGDGIGPNPPTSVYCNMTTDGGGWTRIGDNQITNGDFPGGNGIPSESGSNPNNTIVSIPSPVSSGYAVHQYCSVGWSEAQCASSEYEIHFNDLSILKAGYEIWMTLWVADAWDGGFPTVLAHNPTAGYLFHNRIFYTDGTNSINGPIETLDTRTVNGKVWKLQRVRTKIQKTPNNFHWYIGYDAEKVTDLYFTGVKLELYYR